MTPTEIHRRHRPNPNAGRRRIAATAPAGSMTGPDVARAASVSYRQLDYWTRAGYLLPFGDVTPGSGGSRTYTPDEIHVARVLGVLSPLLALHSGGLKEVAELVRAGVTVMEIIPGVTVNIDRLLAGVDA